MERIKPYVKLVSISDHPLETVRWAADVSRIRIGDDPVKYCESQGFSREELEDYFLMMLREAFGTPLEYISTVWYLDNVSRAAQQQITRTRQASYSIESMRVVPKENFASQMLYHVPDRIANDPDKFQEYHQSMLGIEKEYNRLISEGQIAKKYADAGYLIPRMILWNVDSRTGTIPVKENELGVALVSGFSVNVVKMVMSGKTEPFECLLETLNSERYAPIEEALKG